MKMQFSTTFATLTLASILISGASAQCQNWTSTFWSSDDGSGFSTTASITVDRYYCPSDRNESCIIQPATYNFTAPRTLNISVSQTDEDSIYELARRNFGREGFNAPYFQTINTTLRSQGISKIFLEVQPGYNKSLGFLPFQLYSSGRLDRCVNESLNGVYVQARTPRLINSTRLTEDGQTVLPNGTVLYGTWFASAQNETEMAVKNGSLNGTNGNAAGRIGAESVWWGAMVVASALACGFGML